MVSNKHILEGAAEIEFDFLARNVDNSGPDLDQPPRKHHVVGSAVPRVTGHPDPDIDVAAMPLANLILGMDESKRPYLLMLNWWHLPSSSTLANLDVIEDLTFVGYPDGWMDDVHGTPIVRQADHRHAGNASASMASRRSWLTDRCLAAAAVAPFSYSTEARGRGHKV